jgi:hypothetical protein
MVTERQLTANRINALKSTGPKSLTGKSASKENARKHRLSIDVLTLPEFRKRIEALATILSFCCDSVNRPDALQAAAAELDILRIRQCRAALFAQARAVADGSSIEPMGYSDEALDRYERLAFSRRARAMRYLTSR